MLTYSGNLSTLQQLSGVPTTDTTNSALLMQFFNDSVRTICSMRSGSWPFLEIQNTVLTTADVEYVTVPNNMRKVTAVRVRVNGTTDQDSTTYIPIMVWDAFRWELVIAARLGSNQYPYYAYQRDQRVLFQPIPSDTDTQVVLIGRKNVRDITIPDVTNLTVTTATNGSTAVTMSGGMTADMVGRFIRITETSAANAGDGYWYEIATVTSTTAITLTAPYQGLSIVAGTAACVIGQASVIPEAYQMAPIYRALAQYWQFKENMVLAKSYWKQYDGGVEIGEATLTGGLVGQMLEVQGDTFEGPYVSPRARDADGLVGPPYYLPYQDASGF